MTAAVVTVLIAVAALALPVCALAYVVAGGRGSTEQDAERDRHYENYRQVYDHPRSIR